MAFKKFTADRKIRIVQVGCGSMAQGWVERIVARPDLEMVGLVDLRREAAVATAEKHKLPASVVYGSLAEALTAAKPDAVVDITVPAAHHGVTVAALKAGCHVLGEKPLSDNLAHARTMCAAAKAAKRLYMVTQNRRYIPSMIACNSAIKEQAIGRLSSLDADFFIGAHFGGFRDAMASPLILDMAIHSFDQARMISGCDPVSVYCHEYHPHGSWYKGKVAAICIFEMSRKVVFCYRGSWASEGFNTSWECAWRAVGSKGSLVWDGKGDPRAQVVDGSEGFIRPLKDVAIPVLPLAHGHHHGVLEEFVRSLKSGKNPQSECHDNIKSIAMCLAAVASAKRGKKIPVKW